MIINGLSGKTRKSLAIVAKSLKAAVEPVSRLKKMLTEGTYDPNQCEIQHSIYSIYTCELREKVFTNNRRMLTKQETIGGVKSYMML